MFTFKIPRTFKQCIVQNCEVFVFKMSIDTTLLVKKKPEILTNNKLRLSVALPDIL